MMSWHNSAHSSGLFSWVPVLYLQLKARSFLSGIQQWPQLRLKCPSLQSTLLHGCPVSTHDSHYPWSGYHLRRGGGVKGRGMEGWVEVNENKWIWMRKNDTQTSQLSFQVHPILYQSHFLTSWILALCIQISLLIIYKTYYISPIIYLVCVSPAWDALLTYLHCPDQSPNLLRRLPAYLLGNKAGTIWQHVFHSSLLIIQLLRYLRPLPHTAIYEPC